MIRDEIIKIVTRDPGIIQKEIVTKLTKRKVADKNTIIKHLKRSVKEKELTETKQGKNMTYVVKDMDITHKELDKRIYYELDTLCESLKRIKEQTSSYEYSVKRYLLEALESIKLEKHVQNLIEDERRRTDYEPDLQYKCKQVNELIDKLDDKYTQEFKYEIKKTVRKIQAKIAASHRELCELKNKLHHTKDKKHREWIKEQEEEVVASIGNFWAHLDVIEEKIKFETKDMEMILEKISKQYINEKSNIFNQILELLNKHSNTANVHRLRDIIFEINQEISVYSEDILELKGKSKVATSMDEIDQISYDIKQKEVPRKESEKKLEMILQHLKADKPLMKLYEQLTKEP